MHRSATLNGLPKPLLAIEGGDLARATSPAADRAWLVEIYMALLDETLGTLILLDSQAPRLAHARVRHARHEWGLTSKQELAELAAECELTVSFAGGSAMAAPALATPALRIWPPDAEQVDECGANTLNLVCGDRRDRWVARRWRCNLLEYHGDRPTVTTIVETVGGMLSGADFGLPADAVARSAQLKHYVKWCRQATPFAGYADRHLSFERLLREMGRRFSEPTIVETGCVRAPEDWSAGYSSYLFGAYLTARRAGHLHSVDYTAANLERAKAITAPFAGHVSFHESDSVAWLRDFRGTIDALYLDSMDVGIAGYEDHALAEAQAAEPKLRAESLILLDDTVWDRGWSGKGAKAVPWLTSRDWRILLAGYQTLLSR